MEIEIFVHSSYFFFLYYLIKEFNYYERFDFNENLYKIYKNIKI